MMLCINLCGKLNNYDGIKIVDCTHFKIKC